MYIKATKKRHFNFNNFAHSIICSIFAETIIKDLTDGAYAPKRAQATNAFSLRSIAITQAEWEIASTEFLISKAVLENAYTVHFRNFP